MVRRNAARSDIGGIMNDVMTVQLAISKLHLQSLIEQPPSENVAMRAVAELNTVLAELEATNEELNQHVDQLAVTAQLHEREVARYRQLFERVPVAYLVTDDWGVIQETNGAAEELLNVPRDLLSGKPLSVFVPPSERRAFRERLNNLPLTAVWEIVMQPRGRDRITVQIDVTPLPVANASRPQLGWVLQNLTPARAAAAAEKLLAREVAMRTEAQATVTRLRALHVGLENIGHNVTLPRTERIRSLLEELVPRFARSMSCEIPADTPVFVGERCRTDYVNQTLITRTNGGLLIARRSTPFTAEDSAILLAASNAIALLF
jgi:PAS domain S-box-containing protein